MHNQASTDPVITEFFFVRHAPVMRDAGAVPANDPKILDQAYKVAEISKNLPQKADWHISPLQRCRQTAALFRDVLRPESETMHSALKEQDFGHWHGQKIEQVWEQIKQGPRHNWGFIMPDMLPPQGESFDAQISRVAQWCKAIEAGSYTNPQIVFTHAGTMRAVVAHILGLSSARAQCLAIPYFGCLHAHLMDAAHAGQHHGGAWQLQSLRPLLM